MARPQSDIDHLDRWLGLAKEQAGGLLAGAGLTDLIRVQMALLLGIHAEG